MDAAEQAKVMEQVFSGSSALAGLILVFLGQIYGGFESYDAQDQRSVRPRFVRRCWATFAGFVAALASSFLSLYFNWTPEGWVFWLSLINLAISVAILLFISVRMNLDIG
jgi:hypothetical protein